MCEKCMHKAVCSKFIATGGVSRCEQFREEKKGRWVLKPLYHDGIIVAAVCSWCGIYSPVTEVAFQDFPFCPYCGADMRGCLQEIATAAKPPRNDREDGKADMRGKGDGEG